MMRIEQLLESRVEKTPEKPFVTVPDDDGPTDWTFEAVADRSKQYANALSAFGVESGDRVGVFLPNRPEFVFCCSRTPTSIALRPLPILSTRRPNSVTRSNSRGRRFW